MKQKQKYDEFRMDPGALDITLQNQLFIFPRLCQPRPGFDEAPSMKQKWRRVKVFFLTQLQKRHSTKRRFGLI